MPAQIEHGDKPLDPAYEALWLDRIKHSSGMIDSADPERPILPGHGIFLAHAFTKLLTPERTIDPESQAKLTGLLARFRAAGNGAHCALEREGWGARLMSPETALQLDEDQVRNADYLVSFPQGSDGAFLELGFRLAESKPTILIWSQNLMSDDAARNAEERYYMLGMLGVLESQGIPNLLIEDATTSRQEFEATITPQILSWIGQQQPQPEPA